MKKFAVKLIALALTLCCCLGALAGCGGKTDDGGKLTLFYSDLSGVNTAIKRKSDLYKKYMEVCGVDFTCLTAGGGQAETKLQQYFNTGELPDLFISRTAEKPVLFKKMIDAGAILPISDYVSETQYPNIYKHLSKYEFLKSNIDFMGGKTYMIPTTWTQEHTMFIRKDWLDNLNAKLASILVADGVIASEADMTDEIYEEYKFGIPKDLMEFYRVCRAFSIYDPDNDPNTTTYGYTSSKDMYSDNWLYVAGGGYRVMEDNDGDGKYEFSGISEGNKYSVSLINSMLANGYMDPSWVTNESNNKIAAFGNGNVGIIENQVMLNTVLSYFVTQKNWTYAEAAENIVMFAPPAGEDGSYGIQGHPNFWTSVCISSSLSESKRNAALKFMDWILTDEAVDLLTYGIEGVHYKTVTDENGTRRESLLGYEDEKHGIYKTLDGVDTFSGLRLFTNITSGYYNEMQTNGDKVIAAMENAKTYNRYPDYYMLTEDTYTEHFDGLCDKMIGEFTLMERNAAFTCAQPDFSKKPSEWWGAFRNYNAAYNEAWNAYVGAMKSTYKAQAIADAYNEAVKHGVKTAAPAIDGFGRLVLD